jgi:hypothetical protein
MQDEPSDGALVVADEVHLGIDHLRTEPMNCLLAPVFSRVVEIALSGW